MTHSTSDHHNSTIKVVFCTNLDNLAQLTAALSSLAKSNRNENLEVFVISVESNDMLEDLCRQFGEDFYELRIITLVSSLSENLAELCTKSPEFIQFFLHRILPHHEKVLSFYTGLIISRNLRQLWNISLKGSVVGGHPDSILPLKDKHHAEMGQADPFLSKRALLFNLFAWRKLALGEAFLQIAVSNPEQLALPFEHLFNLICQDKKFSTTTLHCINPAVANTYALLESRSDFILHYDIDLKPWHSWGYKNVASYFYATLGNKGLKYVPLPAPPFAPGHFVSIANQYFAENEFQSASHYYKECAIQLLAKRGHLSDEALRPLSNGIMLYQEMKWKQSCDQVRSAICFWGYPLTCDDLLSIPGIYIGT